MMSCDGGITLILQIEETEVEDVKTRMPRNTVKFREVTETGV